MELKSLQGLKHQLTKSDCQRLTRGLFDGLPDEHIASVAVGPTGPGRKIQSIGVHPLQEMLTGPGCIDIRPAGPKRVQI